MFIDQITRQIDVLRRFNNDLRSGVKPDDAGTYICNVTDTASGLSSVTEIRITVLSMLYNRFTRYNILD